MAGILIFFVKSKKNCIHRPRTAVQLGKMDKKKILANLQPLGLLPLATALTCVILATRGENICPGHPSLPHFLIFAGAVTFGLGIFNKVNKFIVIYGLPDDRPFTRNENQVLYIGSKLKLIRIFIS